MKKFLAILLVFVLALTVFAGCGDTTKPTNGGTPGNESNEPGTDDEPEAREFEGKTFTIGISQNVLVEDYDDNAFTDYIEELTGANIEFVYFASNGNDAKSQLATRIAGGEKLPDIIWGLGLGSDVYTEYGQDGYFVDLKPYYDDREISKNFWYMLEEDPYHYDEELVKTSIRRMTDQTTGAMYVLPRLESSPVDTMRACPYINTVWLDKLGLEMPTDLESFYEVLKAFKEGDPNGNGKADEIPLIGADSSLNGHVVEWIVNMFTYYDAEHLWNVDDDGNVYLPQLTDKYREALQFLNKLYEEGLLFSGSLAASKSEMQSICTPSDGVALAGIFVGHLTLHVEIDNEVLYEYQPLPYWSDVIRQEQLHSMDTYITSDCEDPEAAFRFMMYFYTEDAAIRLRYGEYGVDWEEADEGALSYVGTPAKIKVYNEGAFAAQTTTTWNHIAATVLYNAEGEITQFDDSAGEWTLYKRDIFSKTVKNFQEQEAKTVDRSAGILVLTEQEKKETEMVRTNIQNKMKTARDNFIIGTQKGYDIDRDADWNQYLQDITDLELETYRQLMQTVYDRQK